MVFRWAGSAPPSTADEVADVIAFLASPRAYWINGRNIPVDGLEQPHAPLDRRPY
jgi:NAD(P)-dependent dehydrogenase (short-subunit alcohol dehydrogenase family)